MSTFTQAVLEILAAILTIIGAYLGTKAKSLLNDKTKRNVAETCVLFVEQVYKDLHGEEKLSVAISSFSEMLAEKGIHCSELEMRALLEAAIGSFNNTFAYEPPDETNE